MRPEGGVDDDRELVHPKHSLGEQAETREHQKSMKELFAGVAQAPRSLDLQYDSYVVDRGDSGQGGLFKSDRHDDGPERRRVERLVLDQRVGQRTNNALVVLHELQGACFRLS